MSALQFLTANPGNRFDSLDYSRVRMGNQSVKEGKKREEGTTVKVVPPLDRAYVRWLTRDLERIHRFTPKRSVAITPPDHYIEIMRLNGWLDIDLDDPDLAHLLK